jgi:hypothetical protein
VSIPFEGCDARVPAARSPSWRPDDAARSAVDSVAGGESLGRRNPGGVDDASLAAGTVNDPSKAKPSQCRRRGRKMPPPAKQMASVARKASRPSPQPAAVRPASEDRERQPLT